MRTEEGSTYFPVRSSGGGLSSETRPPIYDAEGRRAYVLHGQRQSDPVDEPQEADAVHVRAYTPPNWLTAAGVARKRSLIEAKGLPNFHKWRFITVTLDRDLFADPLEGYLAGKERMRRFLKKCRDAGLWAKAAKWCWKLEFQEEGWPHWHLLVERTAKFTEGELAEVGRLWGLGRANVEMVSTSDFLYSFKYAFKPVYQLDTDFDDAAPIAPQWFLDYYRMAETVVEWSDPDGVKHRERTLKPETGAKVRFWQTSRGFYTGIKPEEPQEKKPQMSCRVPLPVRVRAEELASTVQVVARKSSGLYVKSACILLTCTAAMLWKQAGWHAINGGAQFWGINSAVVPSALVKQNAKQEDTLCAILKHSRMTLRQAVRLQREPRPWNRC